MAHCLGRLHHPRHLLRALDAERLGGGHRESSERTLRAMRAMRRRAAKLHHAVNRARQEKRERISFFRGGIPQSRGTPPGTQSSQGKPWKGSWLHGRDLRRRRPTGPRSPRTASFSSWTSGTRTSRRPSGRPAACPQVICGIQTISYRLEES